MRHDSVMTMSSAGHDALDPFLLRGNGIMTGNGTTAARIFLLVIPSFSGVCTGGGGGGLNQLKWIFIPAISHASVPALLSK